MHLSRRAFLALEAAPGPAEAGGPGYLLQSPGLGGSLGPSLPCDLGECSPLVSGLVRPCREASPQWRVHQPGICLGERGGAGKRLVGKKRL